MGVAWVILGLCWLALSATVAGNQFAIHTGTTGGDFNITVNGTVWLYSAPPFLYKEGQRLTVQNDDIVLLETIHFESFDDLGRFQIHRQTYRTNDSTDYVQFRWNIQNYSSGFADTLVVFEQLYMDGLNDSRAPSSAKTMAGWPGFDRTLPVSLNLGVLHFAGGMLGSENLTVGRWSDSGLVLTDGMEGSGPLCLFDTQGNTIIISAMSNFMAANVWREREGGKDSLYWGLMQGVDDLPPNFSHKTVLYYSPYGINRAFEGWGAVLRKMYGKADAPSSNDVTLQRMGYYTSYGSYYHGNLPSGKTWRDVLIDVKQKLQAKNITISYFQLDDWWYTKDLREAVLQWSPSEAAFPGGLQSFYNTTSCPVVARGAVWSAQTEYAIANGGQYHFVRDSEFSIPDDQNFWNVLLNKSAWGLNTYEQDNMKEQMLGVTEFRNDLDLGRNWLMQMGRAAADNSVGITYSNALPRQALQSLEVASVTQVRVSGDYQRQREQWRIGVTSLLAWSLGLAPSKDLFWVTSSQPGNPLYNQEPYPELQSVVATLSWGPVAIGDNPDVITKADFVSKNRCCRSDGVILKPGRPATAIDLQIMQMALGGTTGVRGEVWTTHTNQAFGLILAVDLQSDFSLTPSLAFNSRFPDGKVYELKTPPVLQNFSEASPLTLRGCGASPSQPFCLYAVSVAITFGGHEIVLLGDLSKWVPLSDKRFRGFTKGGDSSFKVTLTGAPGEQFDFYYALNGHVTFRTVSIPEEGWDRVELELLPQPSTTPSPTTSPPPTTANVTSSNQLTTSRPVNSADTAHGSMAFPVLVAMVLWVAMAGFFQ